MASLSNNQRLFSQEYIKQGMNGTLAYMKAYSKSCKSKNTARRNASRLLTNADIQEYIEELQSKVEEKAVVKIEDIVNELYAIAFGDRSEIAKVINENIIDSESNKVIGTKTYLNITDTDKLSDNAKK